jgi:hypothetical protein
VKGKIAVEGMEGEMGDEATSSRTSLLGSGDAVGANLPPLGDHPNSMEDEMEVVEGPVQNLDQFFTRVHARAPLLHLPSAIATPSSPFRD